MAKITLANGMVFEGTAQECYEFQQMQAPTSVGQTIEARGNSTEKVEYTKTSGEVILASPKQVALWESKKHTEEEKAEWHKKCEQWKADREAYKPSQKLVDAIKKDRCSITHKVAKTMGFVGTKNDLKALKDSICK